MHSRLWITFSTVSIVIILVNNYHSSVLEMPKDPDETFDIIEKVEKASLVDSDPIRFDFLHKTYSLLTMVLFGIGIMILY